MRVGACRLFTPAQDPPPHARCGGGGGGGCGGGSGRGGGARSISSACSIAIAIDDISSLPLARAHVLAARPCVMSRHAVT